MAENTHNIRKTFAIISHPDAGKTTLTEKLLLFGGAIQQAGAVKARGENRRAHSDWMKVEQERGISVASSVMTFEYKGITFNLLDTPGHEDFSEDTYRVLTAVDSAIMVLDSAKGIESQTKKLFEVCRLRDVPILTFINKLDREGQDPFALLDEIEKTLALDVTPASWPIGMGKDFLGCYDLINDQLILMNKTGDKSSINATIETCKGLDDEKLDQLLPAHMVSKLREDVEMIKELCPKFDLQSYLDGTLTPVFFGSAINNFGVREVLEGLHRMAPSPRPQKSISREVLPEENKVTGFIFKIQANMDPKHRDRIAFMRICSGHFKRGMKLIQVRTNKEIKIFLPLLRKHGIEYQLDCDEDVFKTEEAQEILDILKAMDTPDDTLMGYVTEAYPIVVYCRQLENKERRITNISECEILPDGSRRLHKLYEYNITENRLEGDRFIIEGHHQKCEEMSESLQRRFIENGMPRGELEQFIQRKEETA